MHNLKIKLEYEYNVHMKQQQALEFNMTKANAFISGQLRDKSIQNKTKA